MRVGLRAGSKLTFIARQGRGRLPVEPGSGMGLQQHAHYGVQHPPVPAHIRRGALAGRRVLKDGVGPRSKNNRNPEQVGLGEGSSQYRDRGVVRIRVIYD